MRIFRRGKEAPLRAPEPVRGFESFMDEERPSRYTKRERKILLHQIALTQEKEREVLSVCPGEADTGITAKVREKAPRKVVEKLRGALVKGFIYIFTKGTPAIEKTAGLGRKRSKAVTDISALERGISLGAIERVDAAANATARTNKEITSVEGALLGVLGWGTPDVPIFLAVILKSVYEIAVSYGFDHSSNAEKRYIIALINGALAEPFDIVPLSDLCDAAGAEIDLGHGNEEELSDDEMREAAEKTADSILMFKVIMTIKIIGSFSAATNFRLIRRVTDYAKVKYRKRFLLKLLMR